MKRIGLVEDNPDNRFLVCTILEDLYDIDECETGREALEGLIANKPDLVLLDISLPEMDGPEVLEHIRAADNLKDLPVIALTAHAMAGDREKYLAMGFDDYLAKPIEDDDDLINAIKNLLD